MAVRYFVTDVNNSLEFYVGVLGFEKVEQWGPPFAIVKHGDQVLWLSSPVTSAAKPMPDGRVPGPGGWNRIVVETDDIEALAGRLRDAGVVFLNELLSGPGGTQVLIHDPDGNPIELFQPRTEK